MAKRATRKYEWVKPEDRGRQKKTKAHSVNHVPLKENANTPCLSSVPPAWKWKEPMLAWFRAALRAGGHERMTEFWRRKGERDWPAIPPVFTDSKNDWNPDHHACPSVSYDGSDSESGVRILGVQIVARKLYVAVAHASTEDSLATASDELESYLQETSAPESP